MTITRMHTQVPESEYDIQVATDGLTITLAEVTLQHRGQTFVIDETEHTVTVDAEERTVVTFHICRDTTTDEVDFLVDEYVLGAEEPYTFQKDGPFELYFQHVCTVLVPPGVLDLSDLEIEVRVAGPEGGA